MVRFILFVIAFNSCQLLYAQTNIANGETLIRSARAASNAAIAKHDVDGITNCLSTDVVLITGNAQQFIGKAAVTKRWNDFFAKNPKVLYVRTPVQITISKNDTLAWETGTWKAINSYSGGGNYTAMWCKRNDVWMTRVELFVSLQK